MPFSSMVVHGMQQPHISPQFFYQRQRCAFIKNIMYLCAYENKMKRACCFWRLQLCIGYHIRFTVLVIAG